MALTDCISDMLTRIRNATRNKSKTVNCLNSRVCRGIADVLRDEGYIVGYDVIEDGRQGQIRVRLKYGPRGEVLINKIERRSKPGRRVYSGVDDLPKVLRPCCTAPAHDQYCDGTATAFHAFAVCRHSRLFLP